MSEIQHKATLHELTGAQLTFIQRIEEELEASEGEITPYIEELIFQADQADIALAVKFDSYVFVMDELEGRADAVKAYAGVMQRRIAGLLKRAKGMDTVRARMKSNMKGNMESTGTLRIETDKHRFTIAKNGGKLSLIVDDEIDPRLVPDSLIKRTIDKDAVRKYLEEDAKLPEEDRVGLTWARFAERSTRLNIK